MALRQVALSIFFYAEKRDSLGTMRSYKLGQSQPRDEPKGRMVNTPLAENERGKAEYGFDKPIYQQCLVFIGGSPRAPLGSPFEIGSR